MATTVTLLNFPGSEVELIFGSSPEFAQMLTDFSGPETVSSLLPITPYLVIAKNNGAANIYSITVIWRWQGHGAEQINGPRVTQVMKPGCPPGCMILMAPTGLSTPLIKPKDVNGTKPAIHRQPNLKTTLDLFLQRFKPMTDVSIELDSVIFQDHTYVGPDRSGGIGKEQNERRILHGLAIELLNLTSADRLAYLQAIIDAGTAIDVGTPQQQFPTPDASEQARLAEAMKGQVVGAGIDEALFRR